MFWRFNNMCTTNIDSLLNDEDITLQRLMDEDDIIQECKSSNRKLINFLSKTDVLHEMISLVTKEPSATTPDAVRFKYNNIAAELFSCDVSTINDVIIVDENLLNELCQFVYEEQPLNPLMASFFSKTMAVLFNRKSEKMIEYLKAKEGFLSQLLKHLRTSAIMDLILKLITCVENRNTRVEISQWLRSEKFVENLVGLLSGKADPEMHGNVAQLLCDLLRVLRDMHSQNIVPEPYGEQSQHSDYESDPILQMLESKAMMELLLDHILAENVSESSIVHGITVLLTLLEIRRPPQLLLSEPETVDRTPSNPVTTQCIRNTVKTILPRLKNFHEILKEPPQKNLSETFISRISNNPLGFVRLHIARLVATLIATGSSEVRKELASLGTLNLLMDMMLEFSHNNFLHSQIERSIQHILGLEPKELIQTTTAEAEVTSESGGSTCPVLVNLFTEIGLLQRIMEAWKVNEAEQTGNGATRKAYMGHLIKIANDVVKFGKDGKNTSRISNLIQSLPESVQSEWQEFVETKLSQANKNNEIIPVTSNMVAPRSSSDEEDSDLIRIPVPRDTVAQEVFSDYQMEAVSKHMITQFGFTDDLSEISKKDQIKSLTDALTGISSSATEDKSSADCTNAESSFGAEKTQNPVNQDRLDVLHDSSSDEDDDNCDQMDIDNVNPWAESPSLKMSSDTVDPWGSAPIDESNNPWASAQEGQDENWANFSNAEFVNVPAATSPMEVTEPSEIEETSKNEPPSEPSEEKSPEMSGIQSDLAGQTVGPI